MRLINLTMQQELERLLKDSEDIARDWNTYEQFRKNRAAVLNELLPKETLN